MMENHENYPFLEIHLKGIYHNAKATVDLCRKAGIDVTGVVKGTDSYENSYFEVAQQMIAAGCVSIGDSRINTIKRMREKDVTDVEAGVALGDIIEFEACYGAMIHATNSSSVTKVYVR